MGAISKCLRNVEGGRLMFWCPGCDGAHAVAVEAPAPNGARWGYNGNPDAPTFTPSILVRWTQITIPLAEQDQYIAKNPGQGLPHINHVCHSYVTDGRIQFLSDCTHKLAGQTVALPDWNEETDSF